MLFLSSKLFLHEKIETITKKNIIPITNGEIIFPKKIPNLNQRIFNGVNNFEFINPNIIKIIDNLWLKISSY